MRSVDDDRMVELRNVSSRVVGLMRCLICLSTSRMRLFTLGLNLNCNVLGSLSWWVWWLGVYLWYRSTFRRDAQLRRKIFFVEVWALAGVGLVCLRRVVFDFFPFSTAPSVKWSIRNDKYRLLHVTRNESILDYEARLRRDSFRMWQ